MKYVMDSRIRFSETDFNGVLSIPGLVNYFQDCATFQTDVLGIGYEYLAARGQAWILASWQIETDRMPRMGENVKVATWAYEFKSFLGLRNFTLTDGEGNLCAWANSTWVLYDVANRRPVRVPEEEVLLYDQEAPLAMEYASRKIRFSKEEGKILDHFPVKAYHLDRNRHVNNGQYIAMAAAYLPDSFHTRRMRAEYREQARLGDEISVRMIDSGTGKICICLETQDENPYAVIEVSE